MRKRHVTYHHPRNKTPGYGVNLVDWQFSLSDFYQVKPQ